MTGAAEGAAPPPRGRRLLLAVVLAGAGLRIFLGAGLPTFPTHFRLDDVLFLELSDHVHQGRWLGPYDHRTLVKGPGYPVFLAAGRSLGLCRRLAEELLLVGASFLLLAGLRSLGMGRFTAVAAWLLVLFHPALTSSQLFRTLRTHIYAPQALAVLGLAMVLLGRRGLAGRVALSGVLGLVLGWFSVTREEGLWILPVMALLAAALVLLEHRRGRSWKAALAIPALLALLPLAGTLGTRALVRDLNARHYGVAEVVEYEEPAFLAALGALNRVAAAQWTRWQPLSAEMRERLYAVSPAFAELRGYMESTAFRKGVARAENGGRKVGWRMWALREAAARAGHHRSAKAARAFYRRLAREVNAACEAGSIPCDPQAGGFLPVFHPDLYGMVLDQTLLGLKQAWDPHYGPAHAGVVDPRVALPREEARRQHRLAGEPSDPIMGWADTARFSLLHSLHAAQGVLAPVLLVAGGLAFLLLLGNLRVGGGPWVLVVLALLAGLVVRALMVGLIATYWFDTGIANYLLCVLPWTPLAAVLALWGALGTTGARPRVRAALDRLPATARRLGPAAAAMLLAAAMTLLVAAEGRKAFGAARLGVPLLPFERLLVSGGTLFLREGKPLRGPPPSLRLAPHGERVRAAFTLLLHRPGPARLELDLTFQDAPAGSSWQASVQAPGAARFQTRRELPPEGSDTVRLPLGSAGTFLVELRGPSGAPRGEITAVRLLPGQGR